MKIYVDTSNFETMKVDPYPEITESAGALISDFVNADVALITEFLKIFSDDGQIDMKIKDVVIDLIVKHLDDVIPELNAMNAKAEQD